MPKTIQSRLDTPSVSELLHETTTLLETQLEHASLKHPQTMGVVERSHSALKSSVKLNGKENWNACFKNVHLAPFIRNRSFHSVFGCGTTVFCAYVNQSRH